MADEMEEMPDMAEKSKSDKSDKSEEKENGMGELGTILAGMAAGAAGKDDGAGKGAYGVGGFLLGALMGNGNGLFGGGNADRACVTDALVQSTATATQTQALKTAWDQSSLMNAGFNQVNAELCAMRSQMAMDTAAGIQATKDGTCAILDAMKNAEIANLREESLLCKISKQTSPDVINVTQSVNSLGSTVNQIAQVLGPLVAQVQALSSAQ